MKSEVFAVDSGVVTVAHELKAPLCLLRQMALALEFERDVGRVAERMVATSERALRQVNDLVKVARLSDALFEMEPVNPRRVCDEVVSELLGLLKSERRAVRVDYKNKEKLVVGNPELLHSVIYNFCLNALHYGDAESPSEVFVRDVRGGVRVGVRDFGPAVPTRIWRMIKDGLVKQPLEIAMRPGSSGLGLFIAARFVEQMRGRFGLVRHRDGTSFFVDLRVSTQMSWL